MLRFPHPHRLMRPSSRLNRGTCSSHALHRNFVPRCRSADAHFASGKNYCYCVSIPSGPPFPLSTRRRCSGCIRTLPFNNFLVRKKGDLWPKTGGRCFSSTGNDDKNGEAVTLDEKNQVRKEVVSFSYSFDCNCLSLTPSSRMDSKSYPMHGRAILQKPKNCWIKCKRAPSLEIIWMEWTLLATLLSWILALMNRSG